MHTEEELSLAASNTKFNKAKCISESTATLKKKEINKAAGVQPATLAVPGRSIRKTATLIISELSVSSSTRELPISLTAYNSFQ